MSRGVRDVTRRRWLRRGLLAAGVIVVAWLVACLLIVLRRGASENPGVAGGLAGMAASGIAATFYAANCTDDSPLLVCTWYPLATLAISAVGYLLGVKLLKMVMRF